jgi:hypothetical protein
LQRGSSNLHMWFVQVFGTIENGALVIDYQDPPYRSRGKPR